MVTGEITLELILLVITVALSALSVILAYNSRIFQKRTSIRESIEQLDPFVETDPDFKITHSLVDYNHLPPNQGIVLLFRYISLFNPSSTQGGQPRRFHEILRAGSPFPRPTTIEEEVQSIELVSDAQFTDRGLEVRIKSIDNIKIVEIIHQIQRIFRYQFRTLDTRK